MSESISFRAPAAPMAKAAAILAKVADTKRPNVAALAGILIETAGDRFTMSASDLDQFATVALDCEAGALPGLALVNAGAFSDALKKLAKEKGAQVELRGTDDGAALELIAGRSRLRLALMNAADMPRPSFDWEGLNLEKRAAATVKKLAAAHKGETAICRRWSDADGERSRYQIVIGAWLYSASLYAPSLWKAAPRKRYTFNAPNAAKADARAYLQTLRAAHGLPLVATGRNYGDEYPAALIERGGLAVGMTFGDSWRDYNESRDMPADWQPPAGTEIEACPHIEGAEEFTLDGVRYARMHDGAAWEQKHIAPVHGAILWSDGAFSLPMPAGERRILSALTVEAGGLVYPVAADWQGETSRDIELSAEQIAELCGPVDPSTFVEIGAVAFHHGRVIATGDRAERFNYMQADYFKTSRRSLKNCRNMAERVLTANNLAAQWRAKVARFLETGCDPGFVAFPTAAPVEEAAPVPEPAADYVEPMPAPVEAAPDPVADKPLTPDEEALAPEERPAHWRRHAEDWARCDYPHYAAECERVAKQRERAVTPAEPLGDVAARLERLEAALGLAPAAKRSPAHAAAIRRAWAMRRAMRERADLDGRALLQANGYNRIMREEVERLSERVKRAESFVAERAELVAEIDRLRDCERVAVRFNAGRRGLAKAALRYRRETNRTRAERDGIAGNLAAMTRRAVAADSALERVGGDQPRRFILSTRMEA